MEYRKWLTFIVFLIGAGLLWFIFKYNQVYTQHTEVEIKWTNVPAAIEIVDSDKKYIDVELSGNGFKLLYASIFSPVIPLDFKNNAVEDGDDFTFIPNKSIGSMKESLSGNFKVEYVTNSKIKIDVIKFTTKKVPVNRDFELLFEENLQATVEPYFKPDSVIITGNDQLINEVKELNISIDPVTIADTLLTKRISLEKLFSDFKTEPKVLEYIINAAVMTEGSFQIPVTILNQPKDINLKVIPSTLEVVYNCRLKDYDKIKKEDFKVEVDYSTVEGAFNSIIPKIIYKQGMINDVRHSPNQIKLLTIQ